MLWNPLKHQLYTHSYYDSDMLEFPLRAMYVLLVITMLE